MSSNIPEPTYETYGDVPRNWYGSDDNVPMREGEKALPQDVKYIVSNQKGERFWTARKCPDCWSSKERLVIWFRHYRYVTQGGVTRLHEQCMQCGRTTSYRYEGTGFSGIPLKKRENPFGQARDAQRQRVYDWENNHLRPYLKANPILTAGSHGAMKMETLTDSISYEQCTHLVERVFEAYFMKVPKVQKGRGGSCWMRANTLMTLNKWGYRKDVVLHEAAHALVYTINSKIEPLYKTEGPHGPMFVTVYAILLEQYSEGSLTVEGILATLKMSSKKVKAASVTKARELLDKLQQAGGKKVDPFPRYVITGIC